jgi:hypothetical protein
MLSDVEFCRFEQNRMGEVDPLYSDIGVNDTGTSKRMLNFKIIFLLFKCNAQIVWNDFDI